MIRSSRLVLGVVVSLTLGTMGALTVGVNDASAQANCDGATIDAAVESPFCNNTSGGDPRAAGGNGGNGGNGGDGGNGGLAILHEAITTSAASETSPSLSDLQTGFIDNEMTIIIEDTDETVVINNAGNPGSTGIHTQIIGAPSQSINTGSNNGSADASGGTGGTGGDGGSGGDPRANGGNGGDVFSILVVP